MGRSEVRLRQQELQALDQSARTQGFQEVGQRKTVYRFGRKTEEITRKRYPWTAKVDQATGKVIENSHSGWETAARYAGAAAVPMLISETVRNETYKMASQGFIKETKAVRIPMTANQKAAEAFQDEQHLGFIPGNSDSIQDYLDDPEVRKQLCEKNGHYYLIDQRSVDKGISRFIFVPNGDFSKACTVQVWDAKTGEPIENADKLVRAVKSYCASYNSVEEGWDKEAEKIAEQMNNMYGWSGTLNAITKDEIKERRRSVVIDPSTGQARVYAAHATTFDTSDYRRGTEITLADDVKKEIAKYYDKDLMDNKEKLHEDNKPFTKLPNGPSGTNNPAPRGSGGMPPIGGLGGGRRPPGGGGGRTQDDFEVGMRGSHNGRQHRESDDGARFLRSMVDKGIATRRTWEREMLAAHDTQDFRGLSTPYQQTPNQSNEGHPVYRGDDPLYASNGQGGGSDEREKKREIS